MFLCVCACVCMCLCVDMKARAAQRWERFRKDWKEGSRYNNIYDKFWSPRGVAGWVRTTLLALWCPCFVATVWWGWAEIIILIFIIIIIIIRERRRRRAGVYRNISTWEQKKCGFSTNELHTQENDTSSYIYSRDLTKRSVVLFWSSIYLPIYNQHFPYTLPSSSGLKAGQGFTYPQQQHQQQVTRTQTFCIGSQLISQTWHTRNV